MNGKRFTSEKTGEWTTQTPWTIDAYVFSSYIRFVERASTDEGDQKIQIIMKWKLNSYLLTTINDLRFLIAIRACISSLDKINKDYNFH